MTVHPDFQAILDVVNRLPAADFSRPPLELAREMRSAPVMIPAHPHPVAVEVRKVPAPDGYMIPIRIYRPATPRPHGVLINMHGGGWARGSLDSDEFRSHFLADRGNCAVVSVDYRLAPEYPFPTALDDCLTVARWVVAQAEPMGFAADRLGVAGDSAGANLATVVAMILRDGGGPAVCCQALLCPVCDHDFDRPSYLENAEGKLLTRAAMIWFWGQYAGAADRNDPRLSPLRAQDLCHMPASLILTAEHDPLRDEGEAYAEALAKAGNHVEAQRLEGLVHAFPSLAPAHPRTIESLEITAAFIRRHLGEDAADDS